uniref:Uncharacterized protein n=1 Tax=Aegilops tauschii TaxID=37682 RepID=M8BPH8_AEGTA
MVSTGLSLTAPSSHPPEPPSNQMYSSSSSRRRRSSAAAPAPTEDERLGSVSASPSSSSLPFYNFLPIGPVDHERAPSERKADVSDGEIDLELKLWKG